MKKTIGKVKKTIEKVKELKYDIYLSVNVGNSSEGIAPGDRLLEIRDRLAAQEPAGAPAWLEVVLECNGEVCIDRDGKATVAKYWL